MMRVRQEVRSQSRSTCGISNSEERFSFAYSAYIDSSLGGRPDAIGMLGRMIRQADMLS